MDFGATHSFIDEQTVRETGHHPVYSHLIRVTVADGNYVYCSSSCIDYTWQMRDKSFIEDLKIIKLGGSDIVLANDRMKKFNLTTFDHENHRVTVGKKADKVILHALPEEGQLNMITNTAMGKILRKGQTLLAHLFFMAGTTEVEQTEVDGAIQKILVRYDMLFAEPKSLPPERKLDHAIPLKPNALPVSLWPYRYNYHKKEELKRQVAEMLNNGIIQHSQSPFSSPALLVKKKDGSWRFCVVYMGLNGITIKDKYPIPIIDDLLDDLQRSVIFSKIDLRAGYYRIRMKVEDVFKTIFRTHIGHYEFKVMPFGLTNAPATFQALMNQVFQAYLRKFVLVFFDDILIFNRSLEDHLIHLEIVFRVMHEHTLYAKKSKCSFGQARVEYLGHIITAEGVSSDPNKVNAMKEWPKPTTVKALRGFLGLIRYYLKHV